MSQKQMHADDAVLKELREAIVVCRGSLTDARTRLDGEIAGERQHFNGRAAHAFNEMVRAWNEKANRVVTTLTQFEDELDTTDAKNKAQDVQQSDSYNSLLAKMS